MGTGMTEQKWIDPASCSHRNVYSGLVRTPSGLHQRILQRNSLQPDLPWAYYPNLEEGGGRCASDDQVSELVEIDPFLPRQLKEAENKAADLSRELHKAERTIEVLKDALNKLAGDKEDPPTVKLIRQIVQEELRKASWQLNGLTITHKELQ